MGRAWGEGVGRGAGIEREDWGWWGGLGVLGGGGHVGCQEEGGGGCWKRGVEAGH